MSSPKVPLIIIRRCLESPMSRVPIPLLSHRTPHKRLLASTRKGNVAAHPMTSRPRLSTSSTEFSNATVPDDQVEEYFQFIRAHDEDQCLARLICMMSTEPNGFGAYAKQIDSFFRAYSPRSSQQSAAFYKEAATASRSNEDCATRFAQCQMDSDQLKKAVNL
ncbi:hypothetical protein IscW_ISCW010833 [Ixodes scapularis]|uniref:Uncharacterized protein n=1 Tax=Ixodes scapularis TaxID=6945 RepID=B7Q9P0_IXOSC|nr:hypothetical protein IscW_ISCW010833 [Ixodes scapularis]|eukprot:XP_002406179.1 hypothetical protein IscW_ISCW010833 [Ixodes scapularis]